MHWKVSSEPVLKVPEYNFQEHTVDQGVWASCGLSSRGSWLNSSYFDRTALKISSCEGKWPQQSESELGCLGGGLRKAEEMKQELPGQRFVWATASFKDGQQVSQRSSDNQPNIRSYFCLVKKWDIACVPLSTSIFPTGVRAPRWRVADCASPLPSSINTYVRNWCMTYI